MCGVVLRSLFRATCRYMFRGGKAGKSMVSSNRVSEEPQGTMSSDAVRYGTVWSARKQQGGKPCG
jgi:hypothetical protein